MGVFEDILVKAKSAAEVVKEKTGKFVDVSKLNFRLSEAKSELRNEFEEFGKIVYRLEKSGKKDENLIKSKIETIDSLMAQLEELKKEVARMKNKAICKSCEKENETDAVFCSRCGGNLSIPQNLKEENDDFEEYDDKQNV